MPRVLVVGGGYAGVSASSYLGSRLGRSWSIALVDRSPCHQLTTRLPDVVGGGIPPQRAYIPYRRILSPRVELITADVQRVDAAARRVETTRGALSAEWLLLTLGSTAAYMGVPGAREHGRVLKTVEGAIALRREIEQCTARQELTRVVIVGAGYTGTELAGELAEWNRRLIRGGTGRRIATTVVAMDRRLLPEGNARLARIAERVLRDKGVSFVLGAGVLAVEPDQVQVQGMAPIPSDVVVWAARSQASTPVQQAVCRRGRDGRLVVDPYLRVEEFAGVYAAGDDALAHDYRTDRPATASAQLAVEAGRVAGRNIDREARGRPLLEFRPREVGEALSLGGSDGAAESFGVVVSGRAALAIKLAALVRYLNRLGGTALVREYVGA